MKWTGCENALVVLYRADDIDGFSLLLPDTRGLRHAIRDHFQARGGALRVTGMSKEEERENESAHWVVRS